MAYSSQTTPFATILRRLRDKLVEDLALDAYRVVIQKKSGYEVEPLKESHLAIRPLNGLVAAEHGGGRLSTPVTRIVAIDIYTRSSIDEYGSDLEALCEEAVGHFAMQEAVYESLLFRQLMSDEDTPVALLLEPLHPALDVEDPNRPDPLRATGTLVSTIFFEVHYGLRVNSLPD